MGSERLGQSGFTLLELMVALAVVGFLSGGAMIALTAVRSSAVVATCDKDATTVGTAQEAAMTLGGSYVEEQALVDAGYLKELSQMHDVVLVADAYELVPVGDCLASTYEVAAAPAEPEPAADELASAKVAGEKVSADDLAADELAAEKVAADKAAGAIRSERAGTANAEAVSRGAMSPTCSKGQVDINSADAKELQQIEHLDDSTVQQVIDQRPFKNVEQLARLKNMDDTKVKEILEQGLACVG